MSRGLINSKREIARRIVEGLSSPLMAVVFDKRLVDTAAVEELMDGAGLKEVLRRWDHGELVIYYVDLKGLRRRCEADCRGLEEPEHARCVKKCLWELADGIARNTAKSLAEALEG